MMKVLEPLWRGYTGNAADHRTAACSKGMADDMMRNAGEVSLEDIVRRQHLLGGIDLCSPGSTLQPSEMILLGTTGNPFYRIS